MLQVLFDALSLGSLYALGALGIALIFGVMRLVNFAHGDVIAFSIFALLWPSTDAVAVVFFLADGGGLFGTGIGALASGLPTRALPSSCLRLRLRPPRPRPGRTRPLPRRAGTRRTGSPGTAPHSPTLAIGPKLATPHQARH